jgi:PIN domain nuclease of toxin-antitoxin system
MERDAMTHVLDTAAWLNNFMMPEVFPDRVRQLIAREEKKAVCSISLLEAAIHHRLGRISIAGKFSDFLNDAVAQDIELLELNPDVAAATNDLPRGFPGDPFDRTIAATAKIFDLILITADKEIRDANFCKVEFYPFKPSRLSK